MPSLLLRENEALFRFSNALIPKVKQGLELGSMNPKGKKVLTVFLLECLSSLEVLLAHHAYDDVDQIPPKIVPCKTKQKTRYSCAIPCTIWHLKPDIHHLKIRS